MSSSFNVLGKSSISYSKQVSTYLPLLAWKGKIVQLGLTMEPHEVLHIYRISPFFIHRYNDCFQVSQFPMIFKMLTIAGSVTGGMAATQECMDFCAEKGIEPEIELVRNLFQYILRRYG